MSITRGSGRERKGTAAVTFNTIPNLSIGTSRYARFGTIAYRTIINKMYQALILIWPLPSLIRSNCKVTSFINCSIALFFLLFAFGSARAQNISIQGTVDDPVTQTVYILYYDGSQTVVDSTELEHNRFEFTLKESADQRYSISLDEEFYFTFFRSTPITFIDVKAPPNQFRILNPSQDQEDLLAYTEMMDDFFEQHEAILIRQGELNRRYPDKESQNTQLIKDSLQNVEEEVMDLYRKQMKLAFGYLKNNPRSKAALHSLALISTSRKGDPQLVDFVKAYASIPEDVKRSYYGEQLFNAIERMKRIQTVGMQVPDFDAIDIQSSPVSLSKFKGQKYVLIDFWASWCIPCRDDHPELIELYKQHSSLIEYVSISLDKNLDDWKKAINADGISAWIHLSTEENPKVNFRSMFDIAAVPLRILVDREGRIIKRWQSADENHIKELIAILENI